MTPAVALTALVNARARLPPPATLRRRGIVATAFAATPIAHGGGVAPQLLVFHGQTGTLAPNLVTALTQTGVSVRFLSVRQNQVASADAAQKAFAQSVLTHPGVLMAGARLLLHPTRQVIGTLGCLARRNGVPGLVTCAHVLKQAEGGSIRWPIASNVIATGGHPVMNVAASGIYGPPFSTGEIRLDGAFIPFTSQNLLLSPQVHGLGLPGPLRAVPVPDLTLIGRNVYAPGAATGQRRGQIAGLLVQQYQTDFADLADYLIISRDDVGLPMSADGDSGAVWYLEDTKQPFALHFRRELFSIFTRRHVVALASNLSHVLTHLNATV